MRKYCTYHWFTCLLHRLRWIIKLLINIPATYISKKSSPPPSPCKTYRNWWYAKDIINNNLNAKGNAHKVRSSWSNCLIKYDFDACRLLRSYLGTLSTLSVTELFGRARLFMLLAVKSKRPEILACKLQFLCEVYSTTLWQSIFGQTITKTSHLSCVHVSVYYLDLHAIHAINSGQGFNSVRVQIYS